MKDREIALSQLVIAMLLILVVVCLVFCSGYNAGYLRGINYQWEQPKARPVRCIPAPGLTERVLITDTGATTILEE